MLATEVLEKKLKQNYQRRMKNELDNFRNLYKRDKRGNLETFLS